MSFDESESRIAPVTGSITPSPQGTESAVADIWREVLGVASVRPQDNFFDLGGHSVLLAMVSERVSRHFGREVSVLTMFTYPTVRALAGHIDGSRERSSAHAG